MALNGLRGAGAVKRRNNFHEKGTLKERLRPGVKFSAEGRRGRPADIRAIVPSSIKVSKANRPRPLLIRASSARSPFNARALNGCRGGF
jgi:hypothetical protein